MATAFEQALSYIVPLVSTIIYGSVGLAACGGLWYYLFIVKKRRFWFVDVYEQKSDGKLYLVEKDRLRSKKINYGKQTIYIFKKTKTESIPPPYECVRRLGNKEYADYVRILGEYVPMQNKEQRLPDFNDKKVKENIYRVIQNKLRQIRNTPSKYTETRFVYIPLHKALKYDIDFVPISYDVNMMRINEIDSLDKMFEAKKDFWQKYGSMVIIGAGIVMVIVIAWFGFEYSQKVVQSSLGAADKVAKPIQTFLERVTGNPMPN